MFHKGRIAAVDSKREREQRQAAAAIARELKGEEELWRAAFCVLLIIARNLIIAEPRCSLPRMINNESDIGSGNETDATDDEEGEGFTQPQGEHECDAESTEDHADCQQEHRGEECPAQGVRQTSEHNSDE